MPGFFIYLIKANIVLLLFFLAYAFGLRRLTFYTLNRYFLLSGILLSACCPLADIRLFTPQPEALAGGARAYIPDWESLRAYLAQADHFTIWSLLQYLFWAGVVFMALRFAMQLFSLWKVHIRSVAGRIASEKVRILQERINPFSFFRHIYINPALHAPEDLSAIIAHEKVHARGWHTGDILLGELNNVFYWFNPGAWLMKAAIRENLEFITDRQVLLSGMNARAYQYSLVKACTHPYGSVLANNFNLARLKQRIAMMNRKRSPRIHMLRYLFLLPLIAFAAIFISATRREDGASRAGKPLQQMIHFVIGGPGGSEAGEWSPGAPPPRFPGLPFPTPDAGYMFVQEGAERMHGAVGGIRRVQVYRLEEGSGEAKTPAFLTIPDQPKGRLRHKTIRLSLRSGNTFYLQSGDQAVTGKQAGSHAVPAPPVSVRVQARQTSAGADSLGSGFRLRTSRQPPLFIVDGHIQEDLEGISPQAIETVEVLKDSSAIDQFGQAGANGAVIIRLKKAGQETLGKTGG